MCFFFSVLSLSPSLSQHLSVSIPRLIGLNLWHFQGRPLNSCHGGHRNEGEAEALWHRGANCCGCGHCTCSSCSCLSKRTLLFHSRVCSWSGVLHCASVGRRCGSSVHQERFWGMATAGCPCKPAHTGMWMAPSLLRKSRNSNVQPNECLQGTKRKRTSLIMFVLNSSAWWLTECFHRPLLSSASGRNSLGDLSTMSPQTWRMLSSGGTSHQTCLLPLARGGHWSLLPWSVFACVSWGTWLCCTRLKARRRVKVCLAFVCLKSTPALVTVENAF